MKYPHTASRIFNTPLLIHHWKLDAIIAGLGGRILGVPDRAITAGIAAGLDLHADRLAEDLSPEMFTTRRGEFRVDQQRGAAYVVDSGVALVNVFGALAHRTRLDADSTRILGYQEVARNLEAAVDDDEVHSVLMVLDTPGGEASGAFEIGATVQELAGRKPIIAMVDSMALSAGYAIAAGATEIVTSPTGYTGSIGVVMRHVDFSRALANEGINVTHIFAGDHKLDGNPYEALPKSVRADFQEQIDNLYTMFVDHVATARDLSPEHVRGTQARIFQAQAGVDARLADRIATTDQIISEMQAERPRIHSVGQPARATVSKGDIAMSDTSKPAGETNQPVTENTFTQADLDAARAEGVEAGRTAEAERVSGILAMADTGNEASIEAAHVAITSQLSVEQAKGSIDVAAKHGAKPKESKRMPGLAYTNGHDLGPDGEHAEPDDYNAAAAAVAMFSGRRAQ